MLRLTDEPVKVMHYPFARMFIFYIVHILHWSCLLFTNNENIIICKIQQRTEMCILNNVRKYRSDSNSTLTWILKQSASGTGVGNPGYFLQVVVK